jgi:hypothetical protein
MRAAMRGYSGDKDSDKPSYECQNKPEYPRALSISSGTRGNTWRRLPLSYPESRMPTNQSLRSCGGYQLQLHVQEEVSIPPIRLQRANKLLEISPTPILKALGNKLLLFLELVLTQGFGYRSQVSENTG